MPGRPGSADSSAARASSAEAARSDKPAIRGRDQPHLDHAVELSDQRLPEAVDVEQDLRFGVQPQLRPGGRLRQLLERAEPAGQSDEAVRQLVHALLALVHGLHLMQLGQGRVPDLTVKDPDRDDAHHPAARLQGGIRQYAHEADTATAVDDRHVPSGHQLTEMAGRLEIAGDGRRR